MDELFIVDVDDCECALFNLFIDRHYLILHPVENDEHLSNGQLKNFSRNVIYLAHITNLLHTAAKVTLTMQYLTH